MHGLVGATRLTMGSLANRPPYVWRPTACTNCVAAPTSNFRDTNRNRAVTSGLSHSFSQWTTAVSMVPLMMRPVMSAPMTERDCAPSMRYRKVVQLEPAVDMTPTWFGRRNLAFQITLGCESLAPHCSTGSILQLQDKITQRCLTFLHTRAAALLAAAAQSGAKEAQLAPQPARKMKCVVVQTWSFQATYKTTAALPGANQIWRL